jgi:hypothetical protein
MYYNNAPELIVLDLRHFRKIKEVVDVYEWLPSGAVGALSDWIVPEANLDETDLTYEPRTIYHPAKWCRLE